MARAAADGQAWCLLVPPAAGRLLHLCCGARACPGCRVRPRLPAHHPTVSAAGPAVGGVGPGAPSVSAAGSSVVPIHGDGTGQLPRHPCVCGALAPGLSLVRRTLVRHPPFSVFPSAPRVPSTPGPMLREKRHTGFWVCIYFGHVKKRKSGFWKTRKV